ncbi:hypothetical protein LTR56_010716 [Elasticomyces elasticus]|nr:hypothetical protein LTR56_010716 [Elasticomyces elasticus]KAK3655350.1 hypothetical protein LTR22_010235 [Elasticomyces elasticus]KAK4922084.1 hypothetical protein LTR49_010495 [Elasticomyces elasticus]KAK5750981.1 hypothetical protein LTS12_018971 [Elasticomyces elasticus]
MSSLSCLCFAKKRQRQPIMKARPALPHDDVPPKKSKLLALPAEMRNEIMELAFTHNQTPVDLLTATPPSKSILLTCRPIYEEAKGLHKEAYRRFWTESTFRIRMNVAKSECVVNFTKEDLSHIQHWEISETVRSLDRHPKQGDFRASLAARFPPYMMLRFRPSEQLGSDALWVCIDGEDVAINVDCSDVFTFFQPNTRNDPNFRQESFLRTVSEEELCTLVGHQVQLR